MAISRVVNQGTRTDWYQLSDFSCLFSLLFRLFLTMARLSIIDPDLLAQKQQVSPSAKNFVLLRVGPKLWFLKNNIH